MTIFHLLLLVLAFSTESMAHTGSCDSQTVKYYGLPLASSPTLQYDELLLALQWPTSYCNTRSNKCKYHPIPLKFTVHGLWPGIGSRSVDCNEYRNVYHNIKLDLQISRNLRNKMEEHWPDLNSKPEDFWIYEYKKHGHCFEDFQKQEAYFDTALEIKKAIGDVMKMSFRKGKTLGRLRRGEFYHYSNFQQVTIDGKTLIPQLRCNTEQGRKYPQLLEIVFCSDRQKNLKNCTFFYFDECVQTWYDGGKKKHGYFKFP